MQASHRAAIATPSAIQPCAHDGPDGRVHPGRVPAARQYSDAFHFNRLSEGLLTI
jgi:hypothetical protein